MNLRVLACHTRAHCRACRTDPDWTERVVGVRDFKCPHGVTAASLPSRGLGDTIAKLTSAVGIKPCGGCKKRQALLNKVVPYARGTNAQEVRTDERDSDA